MNPEEFRAAGHRSSLVARGNLSAVGATATLTTDCHQGAEKPQHPADPGEGPIHSPLYPQPCPLDRGTRVDYSFQN